MGDVKMRKDVDGGWAWVALVAAFLILALQGSYGMAVGYFQVEFLEAFSGSSKGFIALIGALSVSGQSLLGPVAGIVTTLFTARVTIMVGSALMFLALFAASFSQDLVTLLFFFGILSAVGTGLCYTPSITVISTYFDRYHVVANGICLASSGLGLLAFPHLLRWLIDTHGWRYTLAVYGCLMAQMCVLASLFFPHDPAQTPSCGRHLCRTSCHDDDHDDDEAQKLPSSLADWQHKGLNGEHKLKDMVGSRTAMHMSEFGSVLLTSSVVWSAEEVTSTSVKHRLRNLLRNRFMWVMSLNQFLLFSGFSIDTVFFPAYSKSVGVAFADLPIIYTVFGISMVISRVLGGIVFSFIPNGHIWKTFSVLQVLVAVLMGMMPIYGISFTALCVYKLLLGITYGPMFLLVTPILIKYLGQEELSVAFGIIMMCCGFAFIITPSVGGLMADLVSNYLVVFFIAGCMIGLAVVSLLLLLLIKDLQPVSERSLTFDPPSDKESLHSCHEAEKEQRLSGPIIEPAGEKLFLNDLSDIMTDVLEENAANEKSLMMNGNASHQVCVINDLEELKNFRSDHKS